MPLPRVPMWARDRLVGADSVSRFGELRNGGAERWNSEWWDEDYGTHIAHARYVLLCTNVRLYQIVPLVNQQSSAR